MPACCQTHVAKSAHHSSQGPYGLQYDPCVSGSGSICDAATESIVDDHGNNGSGVVVEKL